MKSQEIISSIQSIYDRFQIPPNIQDHMRRVASVGAMICDHWEGKKISKDDIVASLLLHDLGNIVKVPLENPNSKMLEQLADKIEYWRQVKQKTIKLYGKGAHEATKNMMREINVMASIQGFNELCCCRRD